ncbi:hypothetical protein ACSPX5_13085 [Pseudomonas sp. HLG18]|uniref:hypothetical protein n=1 Tax=Pseudomonas sp. HLG18 TaxID=3449277 RepID=UPI003F749FFE
MRNELIIKRLPIVDVFDPPYEVWSRRQLSEAERLSHYEKYKHFIFEINNELEKTIYSAFSAATHMAEVRSDNALESFIDDALDGSSAMEFVRSLMPDKTPQSLARYQTHYPYYDAIKVNKEIQEHGAIFDDGQFLFHGGGWPSGADEFVTDRPLSTSFCPQIALRNAEFKGKAYDLERVDLIVLRTASARCHAYVFGCEGEMKHEKEVVFAAGAKLKLVNRTFIQEATVSKLDENSNLLHALVPYYVIEAEIC